VKSYFAGCNVVWELEANGNTHTLPTTYLKLFFLDARPNPVSFADGYPRHFLGAVRWATEWADGKAGSVEVFRAIWAQFKGPQVPHATGLAYWKTSWPAQNLSDVLRPGYADFYGWSCRGIAHLFMECLALHAIACVEVIPNAPMGLLLFLVKNWRFLDSPVNPYLCGLHYGGSWVDIAVAPLQRLVESTDPRIGTFTRDCLKLPGVPAQGQNQAPLGFRNHWIVLAQGQLHDTSYGGEHPNDIDTYARSSIDGWLVRTLNDTYKEVSGAGVKELACKAWLTVPHEGGLHRLIRIDGAKN
jgi:hypothetical protein